jgi:hypothetical protein
MTFDSSKLKLIIVAVLALFAALYLGIAAATAQLETIGWVLGGGTLAICILLGRRVWLLIPLMAAVNLGLQIPGQPTTLLLAQALVIGFCTILFLMRRLPYQFQWTELEFWGLIVSLFILQVYMRNPVSVSIFGGDTVGGRGYILYTIAFISALLFCGLRVSHRDLKLFLPLSILGGLCNLAVAIIGIFNPMIAFYTGMANMKSLSQGFENEVIDRKSATRVGYLSTFGNNLSLWICSYISPLKALLRPLWMILMLTSIGVAAMSGFRNSIVSVGIIFTVGIIYRSGFGGMAVSILGGIVGIILLSFANTLYPLPPNIQRALTIVPGTWEQRYKDETKGSTEWRVEIWKEALLSDRWIQNKWLGDGLGFSAAELAAQLNLREGTRAGISGFDAQRENILSNGDYHSGPVSTIRVIGYIGLFFFLIAQIRLAVHAHRQIQRCRGTEWFPLSLFIGIPLIYGPLYFVLIFGDFKSGASAFLLSLSIMRLLENNLPLPRYVTKRRQLLPLVVKNRTAEMQNARIA